MRRACIGSTNPCACGGVLAIAPLPILFIFLLREFHNSKACATALRVCTCAGASILWAKVGAVGRQTRCGGRRPGRTGVWT